ncbi:GNAT family N-acetyltransferase [Shewanella yunxiaonensis]|uniref:GNAT family N-acetyltransferase n=1 Tax=Shewanella yunxiaonensis TaxID=2829809 RepID=A0ABX7YWP4_9GAMM|nr:MULTISPECIES: GNAT family N-acetyltransferase [Shewanella]MDF0535408.1 GNAT family N-acetyltransferase [Shewanella sp. A32]QUN07215.1 GNAT family N-acetyltransferase [Shewanella yunxiaonensis]
MFRAKQHAFISSERLLLRPFSFSDIPAITQLANDPVIAENTLNIPSPYDEDDARVWLELQQQLAQCYDSYAWAISLRSSGTLIGAISLTATEDNQAETGYWIGKLYRNQGYCSEALQALLENAQRIYQLTAVSAVHLVSNPASGKVMQHVGMKKIAEEMRHNSQDLRVPMAIYRIDFNPLSTLPAVAKDLTQ